MTILFASAGRRAELINCFRQDATALGVSLRVHAVDIRPELSAACQVADQSWCVPRCTSVDYIPSLLEICKREQVNLLVPTIDTELEGLAQQQEAFAAIGTRVAISLPNVVKIARDKLQTAQFLARHELPVPRTEMLAEFMARPEDWHWPVILKPKGGSSSIGIHVVHKIQELQSLPPLSGEYIAQECKIGEEYTVNVYFDTSGKLRCAVPHQRLETRNGEVSKGLTNRHQGLITLAQKMGGALPGARAALCFQAIIDEAGAPWIIELNARFGGGYPLAHKAGARFSHWLLEESLGKAPSYTDAWEADLLMLRYDAGVFVPRDAGSEDQPDE